MLESPILNKLLKQAQQGDAASREALIQMSKYYIEKVTSEVCKRRITWSDDEISVSLIAFNEAIDRYREFSNKKFYSYAKILIHSRLVDHFRKESREQVAISLDEIPLDAKGDECELNYAEIQQSLEHYNQQQQVQERMEEIKIYTTMLEEYGIKLEEMEEASPTRIDARKNLIQVAYDFIKYPDLVETFLKSKHLPITQMLTFSRVSRKTLERGRKYIIALILILLSDDLPHLKSFITFPNLERR